MAGRQVSFVSLSLSMRSWATFQLISILALCISPKVLHSKVDALVAEIDAELDLRLDIYDHYDDDSIKDVKQALPSIAARSPGVELTAEEKHKALQLFMQRERGRQLGSQKQMDAARIEVMKGMADEAMAKFDIAHRPGYASLPEGYDRIAAAQDKMIVEKKKQFNAEENMREPGTNIETLGLVNKDLQHRMKTFARPIPGNDRRKAQIINNMFPNFVPLRVSAGKFPESLGTTTPDSSEIRHLKSPGRLSSLSGGSKAPELSARRFSSLPPSPLFKSLLFDGSTSEFTRSPAEWPLKDQASHSFSYKSKAGKVTKSELAMIPSTSSFGKLPFQAPFREAPKSPLRSASARLADSASPKLSSPALQKLDKSPTQAAGQLSLGWSFRRASAKSSVKSPPAKRTAIKKLASCFGSACLKSKDRGK